MPPRPMRRGLRINVVAPGMTDTPMTAGMLRLDAMREAARRLSLGELRGRLVRHGEVALAAELERLQLELDLVAILLA